ncbi:MAG: inorganic diphosphatase [Desulfuromonas sp.]|nr:MAG: inorganic diphosphatase [Desulfuromonas sp.]
MPQERVYVVGHRNPDTDSICSAIAYARLQQRTGTENIEAARAGNLNRQTEFVLKSVGLPAPRLLTDVHPRVADIVRREPVTVSLGAPLAEALELFHQHRVRLLPVVDESGRPEGLLVLKNAAERFLIPRNETVMRQVTVSVDTLCRCLSAEQLSGFDSDRVEELDLYVGAMASATFHDKMAGRDPRRMVLITGDRENVQREAVELGVRVLIVTGGLPVSNEILDQARENRVSVISTHFDTANASWLSRLAVPVEKVAIRDFVAVQLGDRVEELRLKLMHAKDPGALVLDSNGAVAAVATKSNLLLPSPVKLILVDHNELSQAVSGADKVDILEVVDHHRLGNFHTDRPIRFVNQPIGSTCSVVATLYRQAGLEPEPDQATLLLAGLLSDTVILKSPTCTAIDRELAVWLGQLAGRDPQQFGTELFQAGSSLTGYRSMSALIQADFKEFGAGDQKVGIGQVEVVSFDEFYQLKDDIESELLRLKEEKHLALIGLLVTDIVEGGSLFLAHGGQELPYAIGYPSLEPNLYELKGVLSRKKQLMPHLLKVMGG